MLAAFFYGSVGYHCKRARTTYIARVFLISLIRAADTRRQRRRIKRLIPYELDELSSAARPSYIAGVCVCVYTILFRLNRVCVLCVYMPALVCGYVSFAYKSAHGNDKAAVFCGVGTVRIRLFLELDDRNNSPVSRTLLYRDIVIKIVSLPRVIFFT